MKKLFSASSAVLVFLLLSSFFNNSSSSRVVKYKIFGDKYAETPIVDNLLKSRVFYIVSGHGGPDPGAMSQKNDKWLCEDEYAYDVSLRLARNLISHGAKVYMIIRDENDGIRDEEYLEPDKDETVWGGASLPLNQKARLHQRSDIINQLYAENLKKGYTKQNTIITHVDSRIEHQKIDVFFYHSQNNHSGKSLAMEMYKNMEEKYEKHQSGRGYEGVVTTRNLWMLNAVKATPVYIELGNITNDFDQKRILIPNNRQAMANWLAEGVIKNG